MKPTCYACDEPSTTVEHVPPRSFFPSEARSQLITVPSCSKHNTDLSKDVEYVRNVIPVLIGTNDAGMKQFTGKVMRSFDHSPKLLTQTFQSMRKVNIGGGQYSGAFTVDMSRLDRVFQAMVQALHFHDAGEKIPRWAVFFPTLTFQPEAPQEAKKSWQQLNQAFNTAPLSPGSFANRDVFAYSSGSAPSSLVSTAWFYKLIFYDAFIAQAFCLPEGYTTPIGW